MTWTLFAWLLLVSIHTEMYTCRWNCVEHLRKFVNKSKFFLDTFCKGSSYEKKHCLIIYAILSPFK